MDDAIEPKTFESTHMTIERGLWLVEVRKNCPESFRIDNFKNVPNLTENFTNILEQLKTKTLRVLEAGCKAP